MFKNLFTTLRKFRPDQTRDNRGRWVGGDAVVNASPVITGDGNKILGVAARTEDGRLFMPNKPRSGHGELLRYLEDHRIPYGFGTGLEVGYVLDDGKYIGYDDAGKRFGHWESNALMAGGHFVDDDDYSSIRDVVLNKTDGIAKYRIDQQRDDTGRFADEGQTASVPTAAGNVRSPEFQKWFAGSKVVDKDGEPLQVFHGTDNMPSVFDASQRPELHGMNRAIVGFFTNSPENAETYARNKAAYHSEGTDGKHGRPYPGMSIAPIYLSFQNPLIVDARGKNFSAIPFEGKKRNRPSVEDLATIAIERGHDSLIVRNVVDSSYGYNKPTNTYAAFHPNQIKSVFNRHPTGDPDISKAWDESAHPREPKGEPQGGEFVGAGNTSPTFERLKPEEIKRVQLILDAVSRTHDISNIKHVKIGYTRDGNGSWMRTTGTITLEREFGDRTVWHEIGHARYDTLMASPKGKQILAERMFGKHTEELDKLISQYRKKYPYEKSTPDVRLVRLYNRYAANAEEQFALNFQEGGWRDPRYTNETPIAKRDASKLSASCVMAMLEPADAVDFLEFGSEIPDGELYTGNGEVDSYGPDYGRETEPHVTARYGQQLSVTADEVKGITDKLSPFTIVCGRVAKFDDPEKSYAVLIVPCWSGVLRKMNRRLGALPEVETEYKTYRPHLTVAYVKKEAADKWVGDDRFAGKFVKISNLVFSHPDHGKVVIPLGGVAKAYNADEERDAHGRWVESGGNGDTSKPEPAASVDTSGVAWQKLNSKSIDRITAAIGLVPTYDATVSQGERPYCNLAVAEAVEKAGMADFLKTHPLVRFLAVGNDWEGVWNLHLSKYADILLKGKDAGTNGSHIWDDDDKKNPHGEVFLIRKLAFPWGDGEIKPFSQYSTVRAAKDSIQLVTIAAVHELTHQLWEKSSPEIRGMIHNSWDRYTPSKWLPPLVPITEYAGKNEQEWFSENHTVYVLWPEVLKKVDPFAYHRVEKIRGMLGLKINE